MKFLKNQWVVLSVGIISLALAIIMLPYVTNFGQNILYAVTALALLIYAMAFLLRNVSKKSTENVAFWFEAFEIILVVLIAIGLVLVQFNIFNLSSVSVVVAAVVWLRGIVGVIRGRQKIWHIVGFLVLATLGAYFFGQPLVGDQSILIAISVVFFVLALICGIKFFEIHKQTPKKPKPEKQEVAADPVVQKVEEPVKPKKEKTKKAKIPEQDVVLNKEEETEKSSQEAEAAAPVKEVVDAEIVEEDKKAE